MDKGDILKAIDAMIEEAYERGFADGKKALTSSFVQFADTVTAEVVKPNRQNAPQKTRTRAAGHQPPKNGPRAPKGLTESVMRRVVSFYWMPVEEIQKKAVEADSRVSPKTVYNMLYRYPEMFERDENNRWRRRHHTQFEEGHEPAQADGGQHELAVS
jgi:hypothetical protein